MNWTFVCTILNGKYLNFICHKLQINNNNLRVSFRLGAEVSKVFPDLLLCTMDILYTQYKALKDSETNAFDKDKVN